MPPKTVFDLLREKEAELERLEREVNALRISAQLLRAQNGAAPERDDAQHQLSQHQMARVALLEEHRPMHVSALSRAIAKRFNVTIEPKYLGPVMFRQIGKLFRKTGPGTFGLIEWPNTTLPSPQRG